MLFVSYPIPEGHCNVTVSEIICIKVCLQEVQKAKILAKIRVGRQESGR